MSIKHVGPLKMISYRTRRISAVRLQEITSNCERISLWKLFTTLIEPCVFVKREQAKVQLSRADQLKAILAKEGVCKNGYKQKLA